MDLWGKASDKVEEAGGLIRALRRHSDLALALAVAGVVAMMILPLPTPLLDVLLTFNLTLAVTLLLVSIYVSDALRIATFPAILLVTTLYRLGLNVSSTRLILLQADAGQVIDAFGEFVVRGNYVVGAVVFLILTVIQFVVIAKGSERVAEVAARFTLDALPGKQMAIDADLRSGLLDQAEARRQRRALQRESQFYGSMDGAMKFVKGDAIAGIIIILVNIVAGLTIGMLQRGMDLDEALRVYGLLTIGDGLVSQIPALVISTAAGLVVTRVASEHEGAHLGAEMSGQVLAHPRALAIVAGLLVLLALIPGLPTLPFLLLGALCGATAYALARAKAKAASAAAGELVPGTPAGDGAARGPAGPTPISLELGAALAPLLETRRGDEPLAAVIADLRDRLWRELGVRVPPVRLAGGGPDPRTYVISLDEIPAARGELRPGHVLCAASAEELGELGVVAEPAEPPAGLGLACWIPEAAIARARGAGREVRTNPEVLVEHLAATLRRHAPRFLGLQEVQGRLDGLETTHPALVRAVVPEVADVPVIAEVMRRLVDEGVSVRDLRAVLEALLSGGGREKDPVAMTELVRSELRRQITHRHTGGEPSLEVYLLSPDIEDAVRSGIERSSSETFLALEPELADEIVDAIAAAVPDGPAVILTEPDVRRYVRKLIEAERPEAAVLSHEELEPEVTIRPAARIDFVG